MLVLLWCRFHLAEIPQRSMLHCTSLNVFLCYKVYCHRQRLCWITTPHRWHRLTAASFSDVQMQFFITESTCCVSGLLCFIKITADTDFKTLIGTNQSKQLRKVHARDWLQHLTFRIKYQGITDTCIKNNKEKKSYFVHRGQQNQHKLKVHWALHI